jgi:Leucine-rich repeat (LRR) protein
MKMHLILLGLILSLPLLAVDRKPLTKEESAKVIEAAIRKAAKKPTGELTKADLEKVTELDLRYKQLTSVTGLGKLTQLTFLDLRGNQLTNVKGLEKLTKLERLVLMYNPDLTKVQMAELKKALPKCKISSSPMK